MPVLRRQYVCLPEWNLKAFTSCRHNCCICFINFPTAETSCAYASYLKGLPAAFYRGHCYQQVKSSRKEEMITHSVPA